MHGLLNQLVRLKMALTSVLLGLVGVGLVVLEEQAQTWSWGWAQAIPFGELGGIIIGIAVLSIWVERILRTEQQQADEARLRALLVEHAPLMRDAVLQAFAANQPDLQRVATPDTLDRIITNSLALRLDDEEFAQEIYTDIRQQAVEGTERWHDASVDIVLSPRKTAKGKPVAFDVSVRWEYTTTLAHKQRRFICTSDRAEYAEQAGGNSDTSMWFLRPGDGYTASDKKAFELLKFTVNGRDRPIRRSTRSSSQTYTVPLATVKTEGSDEISTVSYTFRTLTPQNGNLLFFDIEQPTRDLKISLDYTATDISRVSAIDLIPSVRPTRIEHSPDGVQPRLLRVEVDGWTFPRSGVAFVWTLGNE